MSNTCPTCGGPTCPHCGKAEQAPCSHCYCQSVWVGSTHHKACCKCGDRVASYVPDATHVYPYWQWIPPVQPRYWGDRYVTCGDTTNATGGYVQVSNNKAAANSVSIHDLTLATN